MDEIERTKMTSDIVARWKLDMTAVAMLHGPEDPQYTEYIEGLRKHGKKVDAMAERVPEIVDLFLKNRDYEKDAEIERLKEENDSLKLGVSSLEVIVHQLRGALGYAVPDHIPANPEILNRIADALNKEIAALQARIRELDQECAYMDALTGAKMEAEAKWAKAEKHIKEKMDEIAALKGVITDMEADARRFPTMAEFSNLQDAYHDLEQEIAGLKAYKEATQNKESAREARIKELEATHGWHCGCDHWNGPNLSVCAQCGRTPLEGRG